MSITRIGLLLALVCCLAPSTAYAYIGPGAGLGTIAVVLGVLASIVMAFFALLWFPIKRLIKKRKPAQANATSNEPVKSEPTESPGRSE